jgi:phenylalanyl-tRNA synthetase beta chain
VIAGNRSEEHWDKEDNTVDFFDMKADVEALLSATARADGFRFEKASHSALHPGQTAAVYLNETLVGILGAIHPKFEKLLGLNGRTFVFELNIEAMGLKNLPEAKEISKFPANRRDIAIVVEEDKVVGEILSYIEKFGENQLVGLNLFDVYRGKGIEAGYKSLAISLTLQDTTRTLEESDIQAVVDGILSQLSERFGASLRD